MRATNSGTLVFGLVSVPVKFYSATSETKAVSFKMMSPAGNPCKQTYVDSVTGDSVERSDMLKGYEHTKGQFLIFTPEEIKALQEDSNKAIEIIEFVPASKVDPIYFNKAHFVGPDKGAELGYQLLVAAMKKSKKVALARFCARGKQYLILLRASNGGMICQYLHYADEIRDIKDVPVGNDVRVPTAEVNMAIQLIEARSSKTFNPEQYKDDVSERIHAAIAVKAETGATVTEDNSNGEAAPIVDLMAALKASLETEKAG